MHDLVAMTPLGSIEPRTDRIGAITLRENTGTALTSVAARSGQAEATRALIEDVTGSDPPGPGRRSAGDIAAFWMGPDQWMLEAPFETHETLADEIAGKAAGRASVTEQSDAWCRFDLQGPGLAAVFALLCPIDYPGYRGGEATRSAIDHVGCFILCHAPDHAAILAPRSYAGSLHHALMTAIRAAS